MLLGFLKKAAPLPNLTQFDTYLFVGPHPDDIEVACGGTVEKLRKMGKNVHFTIATNGCVGSLDETLTESQIVEIRQREATASAKLLGVTDVEFLPYDDGSAYDCKLLTESLVKTILRVKPDIVFCPDYLCPSELHPDHVNVGEATSKAVFFASWDKLTARLGLTGSVKNITIAFYYTDKPNAYVKVSGCFEAHMNAIALHQSQFSQNELNAYRSYFKLREIRLGLKSGKGRAEGYRALAPIHQHCFPEVNEY